MPLEKISIRGARVNNLKGINVDIPKNKLTVITGLSGSGKSSLAFDTIYAEGQRRYVESLSSYARRFLGAVDKPELESISGLSPTIAIDQKTISNNPRSTVGTITEVYDHLRLLFSKIGQPHCPHCGKKLEKQNLNQIIDQTLAFSKKGEIFILAPLVKNSIINKEAVIEKARVTGSIKVRLNKEIYVLKEFRCLNIDPDKKYNLEILVDQIEPRTDKKQFIKSLEIALGIGNGQMIVVDKATKKEIFFSQDYLCQKCSYSLADLEPRLFSFNSPTGACPDCQGLGDKLNIVPELLVPNPKLNILQGAIRPLSRISSQKQMQFLQIVANENKFSLEVPFEKLGKTAEKILFYGTGDKKYKFGNQELKFEGLVKQFEQKYLEAKTDYMRKEIEKYMRVSVCPTCQGKRLRPEVLAITVLDKNIAEMSGMSVEEALVFIDNLPTKNTLNEIEKQIGRAVANEIKKKLEFLRKVGLDYLTLDRAANTLSGGEAQRIKLATQLGAVLSGVIYVLDEPTAGLHPRDVDRLIDTMNELIKQGNTVIVVEHDQKVIQAADTVIDLGPGAGKYGGEIISQGTFSELIVDPNSLTGKYFSGVLKVQITDRKRQVNKNVISIKGAKEFNLKNVDVDIPLSKLVCLTGVSGSGKSTLMIKILARALAHTMYGAKDLPGKHKSISGIKNIDKVVSIDQSPIGRSPHSNPATYTGLFTYIRDLFAGLPESLARGYTLGHFSFNVAGGRCEACKGEGMMKVEMQFMPTIYIKCEQCDGTRYNKEILDICYRDKNIAQVLDMSVKEAREFFADIEPISNKLDILYEVGLGYIKLGQSATTLSGGEAQRIKLATELSRRSTGKTLYLLDEPTTGLHFADIQQLLEVLNKLVEAGNTVLIIEHNLDVIKNADWIIDMGPEGGAEGGYLVAEGTPAQVAKVAKSYTGKYLKEVL
ncbi:MAG: excinuclease ABC subunit UvrA [Patescibacteria group bacterium]